jgi:hypothetical protein
VKQFIRRADTEHKFSPHERDWGFRNFANARSFRAPGTVSDGCLTIRVEVTVSLEERFCAGCREETGYVGLKNQVCFS